MLYNPHPPHTQGICWKYWCIVCHADVRLPPCCVQDLFLTAASKFQWHYPSNWLPLWSPCTRSAKCRRDQFGSFNMHLIICYFLMWAMALNAQRGKQNASKKLTHEIDLTQWMGINKHIIRLKLKHWHQLLTKIKHDIPGILSLVSGQCPSSYEWRR